MSDAFIEIKPGRHSQTEGDFVTGPGMYVTQLVEITDPFEVTPSSGFNAGQTVSKIEWVFKVVSGPDQAKLITQRTSTSTGPKSGIFGILTALFNGKPPAIGTKLQKADLLGRHALITMVQDGQYLNVGNISAMPLDMLDRVFAQQTGAPTTGTPVAMPGETMAQSTPVSAEAAQQSDPLPF